MSHLDAAREQQARDYHDDVLLCVGDRAPDIARRNNIPLTIALRILVPHMRARGHKAITIAVVLGVSLRTVQRHMALAQQVTQAERMAA